MKRWSALAAIGLGVLLLAGRAEALDCRRWNALDAEGRAAWLEERIRWGVFESPDARDYQVDKARMLRCMQDRIPAIEADFDSICAEGQRRDMSALDDRLQSHFWSCLH